jgi:hypothetical protein
MTTRLFVTTIGMCLIMMLAVTLALGPLIIHASAETVHLCQGIALVIMSLGTPLLIACVFMTWVWEVVQGMIARRRVGGS